MKKRSFPKAWQQKNEPHGGQRTQKKTKRLNNKAWKQK